MRLNVKYIPDIFPSIDFETRKNFDFYRLKQLAPQVDNYATAEKWQLYNDSTYAERLKQSIIIPRYSLEFIIFEGDNIPLVQQTDFATLITDENDILNIYDISLNYAENGIGKYRVTMEFSVRTFANIANPVAHSNVKEIPAPDVRQIKFIFNKKFWSNDARVADDGFLYFNLENDEVLPSVGELYYVHSHDKFLPANSAVQIVSVTDLQVKCDFVTETPRPIIFQDMIIDSVPETEIYTNITEIETIASIFTIFKEKKIPSNEFLTEFQTADGRAFTSDVISRDIYKTLFFLKPEYLNLARYLYSAKTVFISDNVGYTPVFATQNYNVVENTETEMTDLYEFQLHLNNNIDKL